MVRSLWVNGVRINYVLQNDGAEKTILFLHGNSQSIRSFSQQLSAPALKDYRLVALDLPGHGDSGTASEYDLVQMATYVAAFIQALDLRDFILVGHSLGGHIAIEALAEILPQGIFIFGTPPVRRPMLPETFLDTASPLLYQNQLSDEEILSLLTSFHHHYRPDQYDIALFRKTDENFREAFGSSVVKFLYQDEIKIWEDFRGTKCILLGTKDNYVNREYIASQIEVRKLWREEIIILEGGHSTHIDNAMAFNEVLLDFAKDCFRASSVFINEAPQKTEISLP